MANGSPPLQPTSS